MLPCLPHSADTPVSHGLVMQHALGSVDDPDHALPLTDFCMQRTSIATMAERV